MNKKIDNFFNNEKIIKDLAKEIADTFASDANSTNMEYSFDIAKGTGKLKSKKPNTSFVFDLKPNTLLESFAKSLFDEDLKDITKKEEETLQKETEKFLQKVAQETTFNHLETLRDVIRKVVMPTSQEESIPLNDIYINKIEVDDFSSVPEPTKYSLAIGKMPETSINTEKVIEFIYREQEETNKTVQQIFEEEKDKNPLFDNITGIERGSRYLYDVTISLFVDYSLVNLPPESFTKK